MSSVVARQHAQLRSSGCLWREDGVARLRLEGADAASWLHGQCSQNIKEMAAGRGRAACFLDPLGRVLFAVEVLRSDEAIDLLVASSQAESLLQHLDRFVFTEDLQIRLLSAELQTLWVQGPLAEVVCRELAAYPAPPLEDRAWCEAQGLIWRRASVTGQAGVAICGEEEPLERLNDQLLALAKGRLLPMGDAAARIARLQAGVARLGEEVLTTDLLPETPWMEAAYQPGKGCFVGQEIVERLRMKGTPKVALVALRGPQEMPSVAPGTRLMVGGKRQGVFRASVCAEHLDHTLHYVMLKRAHREPGAAFEVTVDSVNYPVRVVFLPPEPAHREAALVRSLYGEALDRFQRDLDERDPVVVELLRQAHAVDPDHEDVLELLGVALHRRGERLEAIELMEALLEHNPKSVMGWTNLSRFYAEEGRIEDAEKAQGQATLLSFQRDLAGRRAAADVEAQAARQAEERRRRMAMFREVLEFDPDDLVALFGLGKALVEEGQHAEALSPLGKAVEVKPDYAAAWLELGRCQERLDDHAAAISSYEAGIAAAGRRGELMPMRAMERRLSALRTPSA